MDVKHHRVSCGSGRVLATIALCVVAIGVEVYGAPAQSRSDARSGEQSTNRAAMIPNATSRRANPVHLNAARSDRYAQLDGNSQTPPPGAAGWSFSNLVEQFGALAAPQGESTAPSPNRHTIPFTDQPDPDNVQVMNLGGKISLIVRDAPLGQVLSVLAQTQGLNIVFSDTVDVRVSITISGVSLDDALDSILAVGGYTRMTHNGIIHVTSVAGDSAAPPSIQGLRLAVFELDYASAVDVDLTIKGLLSRIGNSYVTESSSTDNRRTKEIVVVEDLPNYLERIEEYVAQIDMPPRQVMIQAHILQVDLNETNRHGVNFDRMFRIASMNASIRTKGFANAGAPQAFFMELSAGNLDLLVEAIQTTTDAKTLASPRVLAVSGQESRIQIGEQLGFRVTTTTETSTLESVDFLNVGVVLTVTPRVTRDGHVLMHVRPEVSSGEVNPETGLPEEETTEVETDVLLPSGCGMVIGGLIQEKDSNIQSKVPFLGNLNLIGALFQKREVDKVRNEIIIVLIPHVLPYDWTNQQRNAREVERSITPLTFGPLRRVVRPSEPRLPDTFYNPLIKRLPPLTPYARQFHVPRRRPVFVDPGNEPLGPQYSLHSESPPLESVPTPPPIELPQSERMPALRSGNQHE